MSTKRHAELLDGLSQMILNMGAGQIIAPQEQLAVQFKVSRTLLREALVILEYFGVIRMKPKSGTRIADPRSWYVSNEQVKTLQAKMLAKEQA